VGITLPEISDYSAGSIISIGPRKHTAKNS
jgi:hypothetical protein